MTQLETYTALSALWLAIASLPYILDRIIVRGVPGALQNHSPDAVPQSAWAQRAMRAHTVGVEAFVAFAPLAVIAMFRLPEDPLPGTLAMVFFFAILAHYIIYCMGIILLRTVAFLGAFGASVLMGLRVLGVI